MMTQAQLLDALNNLEEDLILSTMERRTRKQKARRLPHFLALAACLCLIVSAALVLPDLLAPEPITPVPETSDFGILPPASPSTAPAEPTPSSASAGKPEETAAPSALPQLTLPDFQTDGMGFEGYLYYDIAELDNKNPWQEAGAPETLPVYENGSYQASGLSVGLSEAAMCQRLQDAAAALGVEAGDIQVEQATDPQSGETLVTSVAGTTDLGRIQVSGNGTVYVSLHTPKELPTAIFEDDELDEEGLLAALLAEFGTLLDFDQPQAAFSWDRNIYGEKHDCFQVYDAAGDMTGDILDYNFMSAEFYLEGNQLSGLRVYDGLAAASKIGDYPIISAADAKALLLAGHYATSVTEEFPGAEYVVHGELVYRNSPYDEILLPYYRFYVELPALERENGLKDYGAYYVPAVEGRYISNMPLYGGQFN